MAPHESGATAAGERSLLSGADVARTVARMAHQVIEKTAVGDPARHGSSNAPVAAGAGVVLLGIPRRGVPLAHRLATNITEFCGAEVAAGAVDITLYRDDLHRHPNRPLEPTSLPAGGIDGKLVVLVDDVLFSGRTVRAALDALRDNGRPRAVQLAVLVDRGHRELPIRADYVGKNVPTALGEEVAVLLDEVDGADGVVLRRGASENPEGSTS